MLLAGIAMLSSLVYGAFTINRHSSMWDYEGFRMMDAGMLIGGICSIILGLYAFYKKDQISRSNNFFHGLNIFVLIAIIGSLVLNIAFGSMFKYNLPLKKIETVEIEATLKKEVKMRVNKWSKDFDNIKTASVSFNNDLVEYPNIYFQYPPFFKLKDNVINITNIDPEGVERANARSSKIETISKSSLPTGTKVKLKLRTDAHKALVNYMESGAHLEELPQGGHDRRRWVNFYELSVNDEITVQKYGLK